MQIEQLRAVIRSESSKKEKTSDPCCDPKELPTAVRDAMIENDNDVSEALDIITEFVDQIEPVLDKDMKAHFLSMNQRIDLVDLKIRAMGFLDQWEWEGECIHSPHGASAPKEQSERSPINMSDTKVAILPCSCKHEYQDKKYGKGNRVHNKKGSKNPGYRCTVCGISRS